MVSSTQTWASNQQVKNDFERWMEKVYPEHWAIIIERMLEQELSDKTVLDFGCNSGGFLKQLYRSKPFKQGIGIDLDSEALRLAESDKGDLPIIFENRDNIAHLNNEVDFAFSHEVLWTVSYTHLTLPTNREV